MIFAFFLLKDIRKAYSGGVLDIDSFSSAVLEDCKTAARNILEVTVSELNIQIRDNKAVRK